MATLETLVRPSRPSVPETVTLSLFDQYNGRHYLPMFLIFGQPDEKLAEAMIDEVQEGLSRLIDEAPFLAGNVFLADETRDLITLEVPDDGGVPFKIRRLIDPEEGPVLNYKELEAQNFPIDLLNPLVLCPWSFLPEPVAPVLLCQATLIQGGLILALHVNHSVIDGEGSVILIAQWAKHVAAASQGRVVPESELFPVESLDRTVLFPEREPQIELCDFPSFMDGRNISVDGESCWNIGERMEMTNNVDPSKMVKGVSWFFSKKDLEELTESVAPPDPSLPKMTEGSALSALLFRHYTLARNLEQQGYTRSSYHYPCNIRHRIEPPLHSMYLGNSVVPSRTEFTLEELRSSDPYTLYNIASAISKTIDWWTSDRIWTLIGAMEAWPRVTEIERTMDLNCKTDLHVTNVAGFSVSAGYWGTTMGECIAFKLPALALLNGYGLIMPRLPDGGLEVILYMDGDTLNVLKEDKEFTRYARCVVAE